MITVGGIAYTTEKCRIQAEAYAEEAEDFASGLHWACREDYGNCADPQEVARQMSAAEAADWAEYLRLSEADDMQRGIGVLAGAGSKGER